MSHFRVNRNPTPRDLRWFGLLLPLFVALVGAIARWQFDAPAAALGIWSAGGALAALYWAAPPLRRPILVGWNVGEVPYCSRTACSTSATAASVAACRRLSRPTG